MHDKSQLIQEAIKASKLAYAPYSKYFVGAALLTKSGKIFTGCNVENASYGLCICAERIAVFNAVSNGERGLSSIAVVTADGGSSCGACRQVMYEFNPQLSIIIANFKGEIVLETTALDLLPHPFGLDGHLTNF